MKDKKELLTVEMTREQAQALGLLRCIHCKYPENNHFDFDNRPCAHDPTCRGYEEDVFLPVVKM